VDSIRPLSDITDDELTRQKVTAEPQKKHTVYVRLPNRESPIVHRIELIHEMFPGDDKLVLYFSDTGKRLGADCLAHDAFIAELRTLAGDDNVVVK
jgi:hypothetical protein